MNALVTGGKGFIGEHLCRALGRRGVTAHTYDIKDGQDVLDAKALASYVEGVDVVFDCAGVLGTSETFGHVEQTVQVNIIGTLNILRACQSAGVPLVFLGLKTNWHSPYLITKRAASEFCLAWHETYGLPVAVIRGLNVYGPGQHWGRVHKAVPTFIMQALRDEPLNVHGDGQQITDQIHVSDICEVMIRAWECEAWGAVIDGGTGIPTTVNRLADLIVAAADSPSRIHHDAMRAGEPEAGGVQLADPTAMVQKLNFYPAVPLTDGLRRTVDWYRVHGLEVDDRG